MYKSVSNPCHQPIEKALDWLSRQLQDEGDDSRDLACYYKLPYLFHISGYSELANRVLSKVKANFMQNDFDFRKSGDVKSENSVFNEYWAYPNGWLAIAAQKMGRFDVSYPAYQYLSSCYEPILGGFKTHRPSPNSHNQVDVLSTAHLGLTALYLGDLDKAESAGLWLKNLVMKQPNIESEFLLRQDEAGQLVTQFPEEASLFFRVSLTELNQAYFMIGYPIAFLGKLYRATQKQMYLDIAKEYLDLALRCQGNLRSFHFSHKVAWGASVIANITKERRFADFAVEIVDYLLSIQDASGVWLKEEPDYTHFDQTAEIAIWLMEICTELREIDDCDR